MHYLTTKEGLDLGSLGSYPPGEYLVEDLNAADFLSLGKRGDVQLRYMEENPRPFDEALDWDGSKVLIIRPGGFGDLLFLTPILAEMKRRWPSISITVASLAQFRPILNLSQVDQLVSYPVSVEDAGQYDAWIFLENVIEGNKDAEHEHAIDLVARRCGLSGLESKEMTYGLTFEEREWAKARYPRTDRMRIGVQLEASSGCRTYPGAQMTEVIMGLVKRNVEVFLFGRPGSCPIKSTTLLRNLPLENLSFRQSMAALTTCDAALGPDSVLIHVAGALHMPALGLYGSFPWKLRTAYAPTVHAIQGFGGCDKAPCFFHGSRFSKDFPGDGPCRVSKRCEPLARIEPSRVISKILTLAKTVSPAPAL